MRTAKISIVRLGLATILLLAGVGPFGGGRALAQDGTGSTAMVFDGQGRIDRISPGQIVIGDRLYKYEAGSLFYSEDNRLIGSGAFAQGMSVGFILKPRVELVIQKIWKIKPLK